MSSPKIEIYLNRAKNKLGTETDYGLAKMLSVARSSITAYRQGKPADELFLFKLADAAGEDPAKVIAEVRAETERNEERRAYWQRVAVRYGAAASITIALSIGFMGGLRGEAAARGVDHDMYYTKSGKHRRRGVTSTLLELRAWILNLFRVSGAAGLSGSLT